MRIGEANALLKIMKFLTEGEGDPESVALAMRNLTDRACSVLQVSGEQVISSSAISAAVFSVRDMWEDWGDDEIYDRYGANVRPIEDVQTGGLL